MEENYINYNLFKSRTGFDPLRFFENNKSISYEDFKSYLNSRKVKSPGKDYYDRAIKHVNKELEIVKVEEPVLEVVQAPKVEVEKTVKKQVTTRKRRSRKKKSNE